MYDYDGDHNDNRSYADRRPEPSIPADRGDGPDKPMLQMVGTDGNVFAIIGRVARCLRTHRGRDVANEWVKRAMACHDYDDVLTLMYEYVDPY